MQQLQHAACICLAAACPADRQSDNLRYTVWHSGCIVCRHVLQHPAIMKAGFGLCGCLPQIAAAGSTAPAAGCTVTGLLHDAALAGRLLWPVQEVTLALVKVSAETPCISPKP